MSDQVKQIKDNLNNQLNQSLLRSYEIRMQMEALEKAYDDEEVKVKMIRDTLQGMLITEQATTAAAQAQSQAQEAIQASSEAE